MKQIKYLLAILLFVGCSKVNSNKKYVVVSSFNDVVFETNDKEEAFKTAQELTSFGRVFASKPCYFVLESK